MGILSKLFGFGRKATVVDGLSMKFGGDAAPYGEHGSIYVDHVGRHWINEPIAFVFIGVGKPPVLDDVVFNFIWEQAKRAGYIPRSLRAYRPLVPVIDYNPNRPGLPRTKPISADDGGGAAAQLSLASMQAMMDNPNNITAINLNVNRPELIASHGELGTLLGSVISGLRSGKRPSDDDIMKMFGATHALSLNNEELLFAANNGWNSWKAAKKNKASLTGTTIPFGAEGVMDMTERRRPVGDVVGAQVAKLLEDGDEPNN